MIPWAKINIPTNAEVPHLTAIERGHIESHACFASIKSKKRTTSQQQHQEDDSDENEVEECAATCQPDSSTCKLFPCPEPGCVKHYQRYSSLQHHLDCGKHKFAPERQNLDKAALGYGKRLEEQAGAVPKMQHSSKAHVEASRSSLSAGWALKSSQAGRKRFSANQKNYLTNKFNLGETTGRKANPDDVAKDMMRARDVDGNRMFSSDEFLTARQIASFFSRLASKQRRIQDTTDSDESEDEDNAELEDEIQEMQDKVIREVALEHPMVYDCYNICDLIATSKLSKLSVSMLQLICKNFDIDTCDIQVRRKKPYLDKLTSLYQNCSCQQ